MLCNVEHVLEAAPDIAVLVGASPGLVVLATSRAPLRIRSEHERRIEPLGSGAADRLFHDRASAAGGLLGAAPQVDAAVRMLLEGADGLPLAIELAALAAARLGPITLVAQLNTVSIAGPRDLPARQRSMAATLLWSLNLLSPGASGLLARLAVCIGGFSVSLAEAIGGIEPGDVFSAPTELLEHSLILRDGEVDGVERFRLLEPLRQNASSRLSAPQRDDARTRLIDWTPRSGRRPRRQAGRTRADCRARPVRGRPRQPTTKLRGIGRRRAGR